MRTGSDSKKLTLIYLQQLFLSKTDNTHYLRMPQILEYLEERDIFVDRRTIYKDIRLLNHTGFEIIGVQEKGGYKYHHTARLFSTNELKFLIDSVATSKFLTDKKSRELITKLKTLGCESDKAVLDRNILIGNRIKSMNDKVLKNLDYIYEAITNNSQIKFQYMRWNEKKVLEIIKEGEFYSVSPFAVTLRDNNYYLVAYDNNNESLRHYRVDKIQSIKLTYDKRNGIELFRDFNIVDYTRKTFGMFSGTETTVTVEIPQQLTGVFIDRFGEDVHLRKNFEKPDTILARFNVVISMQFYGWIFGLGSNVRIISPENIKKEFAAAAMEIIANYTE